MPLPELSVVPARGAPPDVEIRLLETPLLDSTTKPAGLADVADDITMLWWTGIGRFVVSDGCDICVALAPNADPTMVRLYLLGPVFHALLRQRGWIVLRAGAATIQGRVVAVVPTPAAIDALAERGHAVLARDVVAIQAGDHITPAVVQPSIPWLANRPLDDLAARRLWCDAARSDAPLTLDSLYIVSDGPAERLATAEAFAELGACLFDDLTWPGDVRRALRLMFHLASTLPVRRTSVETLLNMADGVATRDSVRDIRG